MGAQAKRCRAAFDNGADPYAEPLPDSVRSGSPLRSTIIPLNLSCLEGTLPKVISRL